MKPDRWVFIPAVGQINMAEDKTVRLILGVLLVLISLPMLTMGGTMMMGGFGGMMGSYGGFFWPGMLISYFFGIGLLVLGIYLISGALKN